MEGNLADRLRFVTATFALKFIAEKATYPFELHLYVFENWSYAWPRFQKFSGDGTRTEVNKGRAYVK